MESGMIRQLLVRSAVVFLFVIFGIWEIVQPSYWTAFVPLQLNAIASPSTFVAIHGVLLLVIGIAVLLGLYLREFALVGALAMLQIVVFLILTSGFTDLLVRDVSITLLVLSLAFEKRVYFGIGKQVT